MASTSSRRRWRCDVFLSFRGPATRKGITSELYHRLERRGIKTFIDHTDLEVGASISRSLLAAIEESRFAIVIVSSNYASSSWCLDELVKIIQCKKEMGMEVVPLFYNVEPHVVQHQKGSFEVKRNVEVGTMKKFMARMRTNYRHGELL